MKLKAIGSNQTSVKFETGTEVFFSYETPVAAYVPTRGYIRTNQKYSVTTSKHINKWLEGVKAESVEQAELDALIEGRV